MIKEELDLMIDHRSSIKIGLATYMAFIIFGLIPLSVYVMDMAFINIEFLFIWSCILTTLGFSLIGLLKSYVTQVNRAKGIAETLVLGALAALVAYFVGDLLEQFVMQ